MVDSSDADVVKANMDLRSSGSGEQRRARIIRSVKAWGGWTEPDLTVPPRPSAERSFVCRLQTSKAFKLQHGGCCSMLVEGSFRSFPQPPAFPRLADQPLFVALCTPTVDRLQGEHPHSRQGFSSVHRLDMSFTQVSYR